MKTTPWVLLLNLLAAAATGGGGDGATRGSWCPEGWVRVHNGCCFFIREEVTWAQACSVCEGSASGGRLVSVSTEEERNLVHDFFAGGGRSASEREQVDKVWLWGRVSPDQHLPVTHGGVGGMVTAPGPGECVEIRSDAREWRYRPCNHTTTALCEAPRQEAHPTHHRAPHLTHHQVTASPSSGCWEGWTENPDTGECYLLVEQQSSFSTANSYCTSLAQGDDIPTQVSLTTAQEQDFVYMWLLEQSLSGEARVWLGMQNLQYVYWLDGSPVGYFHFSPGEPDSYVDGNFCIELAMDTGLWEDSMCSVANFFLCEMKGSNYVDPVVPPAPPAECPPGWSFWGGHCYYFSNTYLTWDDSNDWCQDNLASSLISIESEEENSFVLGEVQQGGMEVWLGMMMGEFGTWSWVDGSPMNYTHWVGDHPPTNTDSNTCVKMVVNNSDSDGRWGAQSCRSILHYVCKMPLKTCPEESTYSERRCYYPSQQEDTWSNSRSRCKQWDEAADLVSIHSVEENTFFGELMKNASDGTWLGLTYNQLTNWTWSDGQDTDFSMWDTNEPDSVETDQCVVMTNDTSSDYSFRWRNIPCESIKNFGCELFPTHSVGCEDGWLAHAGWCYWYSYDASSLANFKEARWDCQVRGSDLVSIHTDEENSFVDAIINQHHLTDVWLGVTDDGHQDQMMWLDGSPLTFTLWKALNDYDVKYHPLCGFHYKFSTEGEWGVGTCDAKNYYVCKKPYTVTPLNPPDSGCNYGDAAYLGSCYTFPSFSHTWSDANNICRTKNATLVVINGRGESDFLSTYLSELGASVWIGLSGTRNFDGSFTYAWVNNDPVTVTYWAADQPNPTLGSCVTASGDRSLAGVWSATTCTETFQYICEYESTGQAPTTSLPTQPPEGECAPTWTLKDARCYKVLEDRKTWSGSEAVCASSGGHLVSVATAQEQDAILSLVMSSLPDHDVFWVGLTSGGETGYQWIDGTPFAYVNWAPGQPDNYYGREYCGSADRDTLELSDDVCSSLLPFVCEATPGAMISTQQPPVTTPNVPCDDDSTWSLYNEYCYKIFSQTGEETWWDSHLKCRQDGGELVSIHSLEENYWLLTQISDLKDSDLWIGGRTQMGSGYTWVDGSPFDFDNWAKGQPDNYQGAEDCVSISAGQQGFWSDKNCGQQMSRVCKRPYGATLTPAITTILPQGTCSSGWIQDGAHCLKFFPEKKTFEEARASCQQLGEDSDLASLHSPDDQAYVTAALGMVGASVWIGLRNTNGFHWVDQTAVTYTNWAPGEPSGHPGLDVCVEVYATNGQWNDDFCDALRGYVCKKKQESVDPITLQACSSPYQNYVNYSGACFRAEPTPTTWQDSEAACVQEGSHLVSVKQVTQGAMVWVLSLNQPATDPWIGFNNLQEEHQFVWSDGWPTTYTNWGHEQPNTSLSDHNCVRLDSNTGLWLSEKCDQLRPFICKHEDGMAPTPEPPVNGLCPGHNWLDLGGAFCYLTVEEQETFVNASIR
ncbi:macrophage mannose receptor 1 isoform X2 [Cherax quadricarinatus]|uniref:macrophage mannose receptor 1 isoform X2 n=1 Tax=Cherax quadricarinatus TaxID=27406 RepID=UPI00387E299C